MFLLLFPGFFLYQSLAAFGVIPPVLGGALTLFCFVALVCTLPFAVYSWRRTLTPSLPFIALGLIVLAYAGYFRLFGSPIQRSGEVLLASLKLLVGWGGLFVVGLLINSGGRWFRPALVVASGMAILTVPFLINTPALSPIDTARAGLGVASYQFFSTALSVLVIFGLAYSWGRKVEPFLMAGALVAVFLLGARSDLVSILAIFGAWAVLKLIDRRLRPVLLSLIAAIVFGAVALGAISLSSNLWQSSPGLGGDPSSVQSAAPTPAPIPAPIATPRTEPQGDGVSLPGSDQSKVPVAAAEATARATELLDLENSASWQERLIYMEAAWNRIRQSPVFGEYAGQIREFGSAGAYVHNALSAWSSYGLLAFLLYVVGTVAATARACWIVLVRGERSPEWIAAAAIAGFCLLQVLLAKSVYWPFPALAWGVVAGLESRSFQFPGAIRRDPQAAV